MLLVPARGRSGQLWCHCNRVVQSWCLSAVVTQSLRYCGRAVASRRPSRGEFKFAVAAVGTRSPLKRGAPALSCSAKASHGARGDRALRRHPHRACSRIDATALRVRGQNAAAHRLRSRLRSSAAWCIRSAPGVLRRSANSAATLGGTVCCDLRVLFVSSAFSKPHQTQQNQALKFQVQYRNLPMLRHL